MFYFLTYLSWQNYALCRLFKLGTEILLILFYWEYFQFIGCY